MRLSESPSCGVILLNFSIITWKVGFIEEYNKVIRTPSYKLLSKTVFRISNEALNFINPISTNDLNKPSNAFLDSFGKLIALVDQTVINNEIYLVVEEKYKEKLLANLNKYTRFSKSKIEELNLNVVHFINKEINGIIIKKNIGCYVLLEDLGVLGGMNEISDEVYNVIRIENKLPVQGIDFDNPMFLETGLIEAISFTKGCYPGQEIIARVNSRSKPVKKLVRILFDKIPEIVTINNEEVGKITSSCFSPKYNMFLVFAMIKDYDKKLDYGKILENM